MSFRKKVKGREIAYITRLVSCFGLVEQQQMRSLFSHLTDREYGMILSRLNNEGQIFWQKNGEDIAGSRMTRGKRRNDERVRCFWVFIAMKDVIRDFCGAESPVLLSFVTESDNCVMIPVCDDNIGEINKQAASLRRDTIRFLVAKDAKDVEGIVPRAKNDYVVVVDETGQTETYGL